MSIKIEKPSKKSIILKLDNGKKILINKPTTSIFLVSTREMKVRIEQNFLKSVFFRPDLITTIKVFLPNIIPIKNIPYLCQKKAFFNYLAKNSIKIESNEEKEQTEQDGEAEEEEDKTELEMHLKRIVEEDHLELFQKETENNMNIILKDSFFEIENMKIPILHYCIIKKAIKCFKFLILNGADPFQTLSYEDVFGEEGDKYKWDCMTIAICFGEWEIMKILEERGINKLNNPNVWKAAALTHRNNLLKLFISNKDHIEDFLFNICLQKGLEGSIKGNNIKEVIIFISKGTNINAKDIIYQNII